MLFVITQQFAQISLQTVPNKIMHTGEHQTLRTCSDNGTNATALKKYCKFGVRIVVFISGQDMTHNISPLSRTRVSPRVKDYERDQNCTYFGSNVDGFILFLFNLTVSVTIFIFLNPPRILSPNGYIGQATPHNIV